jgi:hypothetical protein
MIVLSDCRQPSALRGVRSLAGSSGSLESRKAAPAGPISASGRKRDQQPRKKTEAMLRERVIMAMPSYNRRAPGSISRGFRSGIIK